MRGLNARIGLVTLLLGIILALAACSSVPNGGVPATTQPQPTIAWQNADIGPVGAKGSMTVLAVKNGAENIIVDGSGADIYGTSDSFHFEYIQNTANVELQARVDSLQDSHTWAKAGLMVRDSLQPDAVHAMVDVTPTGAVEFIWRSATGSAAQATVIDNVGVPAWLRLVRNNDTVTGSYSKDGTSWTEVDSVTLPFTAPDDAGVAVTSHVAGTVTQAHLSDVKMTEPGAPSPSPTPSPSPSPTPTPTTSPWVCPSQPLSPAYQPTLYVSTSGSDSNSGRDISHPLRTLQAAADVAGPGDVVWVRGGVYSSNVAFNNSGTASSPIVYESFPGECATLDGTGLSSLQRVRLEGVRYNVFRNFVVRNSPGEGVLLYNASNNVISNIATHDNYLSGIMVINGDNNLFSHFIAYGNYDAPNGGNADGISVHSGDSNRVEDCVTFDNSDDGVDVWMTTHSLVSRCISYHNGFQGGDGNGIKAGGNNVTGHTVVRDTISYYNKASGFDYNSSPGVTFENDTAYANNGIGFVLQGGTATNNLAFYNGKGAWATYATGNATSHNSWQLGITDPGFASTDPANANFMALGSGSPAIDAGTDIGLPYGGAAPDLGALQRGDTIASQFDGLSLSDVKNH